MAIGSTLSVGLIGLKAFIVQVQAFISPGLPYFSIIGLPDASLSEARERVKSACQATGFGWPQTRVTVNMSPAAMPKRGSSHDLAIAASVLCAAGAIGHDCLEDTIVLGEVNLDGSVLPIHGLANRANWMMSCSSFWNSKLSASRRRFTLAICLANSSLVMFL